MQNLSNYKAVILAGGKGTRLYPITYEIPKPLLPVKKKPIINYLVNLFLEQGIKDIAVLINESFSEEFDWWKKRYYGSMNSPQAPDIKIFEENEPLGTFGGLWLLKDWISNNPFFLTNGDELKKIDLEKMADFHEKYPVSGTIALVKVPDPQNYGVVICQNGFVQKFLEKPKNPPTKYINSGLYLFSPEIFKYHPGPKFSMVETDIFPKLAKEKKLAGFKFNGKWLDCGTWQRYEEALRIWQA
jgi:NDP-sugar pyrophosphorylase family protein